ncbi:MAG: DsbE family thiol:disulfide interchange protein, partial [Methylocystis sp.]
FVGPLTPSAMATTLIPEIEKAMAGGAATTR